MGNANQFSKFFYHHTLQYICSKGVKKYDPKFKKEGVAPTNHSFYQTTRINGLSYGVKI